MKGESGLELTCPVSTLDDMRWLVIVNDSILKVKSLIENESVPNVFTIQNLLFDLF